jgi:[ribosomal protein S5]-alanine N-acetyltransferase
MKTIKGKGFILRPVKVSDAKGILECYEDKKTKDNFMSALKDLESAEKSCKKKANEFRKKKPSDEKWIIEVNGKFAGWVELNALNERNFEHRAYIGYCVHPKFRGKGLATKATKLLSKYSFKKYKLKRLEAMCRDTNKASARVLEKSGFKLEGILYKNKFKDGKYLNDMVWAIVK